MLFFFLLLMFVITLLDNELDEVSVARIWLKQIINQIHFPHRYRISIRCWSPSFVTAETKWEREEQPCNKQQAFLLFSCPVSHQTIHIKLKLRHLALSPAQSVCLAHNHSSPWFSAICFSPPSVLNLTLAENTMPPESLSAADCEIVCHPFSQRRHHQASSPHVRTKVRTPNWKDDLGEDVANEKWCVDLVLEARVCWFHYCSSLLEPPQFA